MKRVVLGVTLVAVFMLSAVALAADVPELRGTWVGNVKVQTTAKYTETKAALVIDKQNGNMFVGYKMWFNANNVLQREALVGVYDGKELLFGEGGDGVGEGYLTGKQTMTVRYVEPGSSVKAILYTLERIHFTTGFVEIDKDGNDVLVRAEITNHYPLNAERIMKEADADKDGKLTKKEWEAWKKMNDFE